MGLWSQETGMTKRNFNKNKRVRGRMARRLNVSDKPSALRDMHSRKGYYHTK